MTLGKHSLRYSECAVCICYKYSLDYHNKQLEVDDLQEELGKKLNKLEN